MKMIHNFRNVRTIIVLFFLYNVTCHPRPDDGKDIKEKTTIIGNNEHDNKTLINEVNLPKVGNKNRQNDTINKKHNFPNRREGDEIIKTTGEETDESKPDETTNEPSNQEGFALKKVSSKKKNINGNIEMQDGNIIGEIIIPDESDDHFDNGSDNSLSVPDSGGTMESKNSQDNSHVSDLTDSAGSLEIPDEDSSNVSTDDGDDNQSLYVSNDDGDKSKENEGDLSGSINVDTDSIEGTIDVPDDIVISADNEPNNGENNHGNGYDSDGIYGTIEVSSNEGINGTVHIPDDIFSDEPKDSSGNDITSVHNDKSQENYKPPQDKTPSTDTSLDGKTCWMNLNSEKYLDALDELDDKYKKSRQEYQQAIGPQFNQQIMEVLLKSQGKAHRAVHQAQGDPSVIPAGLNLGGYGMMRMQGSLLFFHRLKLRNDTRFRVNYLNANLMDMSLVARLSLHDLHLHGAYERTTTEADVNVLYFVPNYGELNVLLKDVSYKMEGRLRMLNNRLMIELINSAIVASDVLLTYANSSAATKVLAQDNIEDFVDRLKSDLDLWLKDYFNDYLMYFGIVDGKNTDIQVYEKQKTIKVNEYADYALKAVKKRIRDLGFASVKLPHLTILTATLQQVKLKSGILRGLDSMYRRSVGTTIKEDNIRKVDFMLGFSNLKVEYQYEAMLGPAQRVLTGALVLSADELTAHLELAQMDGSQTVAINIDTIVQLKSESLTVEGPANRMIANFKYILENPIIAIMTNIMKHNIKMLKTLPGCDPKLWGEKQQKPFLTPYQPRNPGNKPGSPPTAQPGNNKEKESEELTRPVDIPETTSSEDLPESAGSNDEPPPFNIDTSPPRENDFIKPRDEWEDYVFSKNDSVEIEAPINGKLQKLKLERNENFVLSKVP